MQDQQPYLMSVAVETGSEASLRDVAGWLLWPVSGLQEKAKEKAVTAEQSSSPLQPSDPLGEQMQWKTNLPVPSTFTYKVVLSEAVFKLNSLILPGVSAFHR